MFVLKKFEAKYEEKKINLINYFYIFLQSHFTYFTLLYKG